MKKLNLAIITLLLVFQTVLSPISVFADDLGSTLPPSTEQGTNDVTEEGTAVLAEAGDSSGEIEEGEDADSTTEDADDSTVETGDDVTGKEEENLEEEPAEELKPEELLDEDATAGSLAESMQDNVNMSFSGLKLFQENGVLITDANDLANYSGEKPKKGDTVYLNYTFSVNPEKDYGVGSEFSFQLPANMIEEYTTGSFNQSRTLEETDGWAAYTAKYNSLTKTVTVTLDSELGAEEAGNIKFEFMAKFGNFADENELDQTLIIPIEGGTSVTLPFKFAPSGSGKLLTKSAGNISRSADGTVTIPWTVWVNTGGENLENAKLTDAPDLSNPDAKHELTGVITVERYKIGLNGFNPSNPGTYDYSSTTTAFPIALTDGYYAYKITYNTMVTADPTKSEMLYKNDAKLTGTNIPEDTKVSASQTVKYGPSLEKTKTGDKYKSTWTIKYNWLGQKIPADKARLTDTMTASNPTTGKHKIDYNSFEVYRVTLSNDGQTEQSSSLLSKGTDYTLVENDYDFLIDFDQPSNTTGPNGEVTSAFKIVYETELEDEFVTDANEGTITNTVTRGDGGSAKAPVALKPNIFNKTIGTIDYINKTITWILTINAEKDLKKFVIEDDFTTINKPGDSLQHTLTEWNSAGDFYVIEGASGITNNFTDKAGKSLAVGSTGLKIEFTDTIPKDSKVTIKYKTKYDIKPNGGVATAYVNTADAIWKGASNSDNLALDRTDSYTPDSNSPTNNNGYKKVEVNNNTQEFAWRIGVNINKQDINNATLTDTLGVGHYIPVPDDQELKDQITISKLNLTTEEGTKDSLLDPNKWSVKEKETDGKVTGFEIKFFNLNPPTEQDEGENNQAYLIEYKTKDADAIYGQSSGKKSEYTNTATLGTPNNGQYSYNATAEISDLANQLIKKSAKTDPVNDIINWTVTINASNSKLENITLTDKPSSNQKVLTNTFKKQEIKMDKNGASTPVGKEIEIDASEVVLKPDGSFDLNLGELNNKGFIVTYSTFFMGDGNKGDTVSNEASIGYAGAGAANTTDGDIINTKFQYSSSDTNASGDKGILQLKKIKVNPLTGVSEEFPGVKFELWNKNNTIKLDEGTTGANGILEFKQVRYGKYTLRETSNLTGYIKIEPITLTMGKGIDITPGVDGKAYIIKNMEDVSFTNACPEFTLTINDINGQAVANKNIKLVDDNGDTKYTGKTNATGQVSDINRPGMGGKEVEAGQYNVLDGDTNIALGSVLVKYGKEQCYGKIQPAPKCDNFTIVVEDTAGNIRTDIKELTLKSGTTEVKVSPNAAGKFIFDSNKINPTDGVKPGNYTVYEGNLFLGTVNLTYAEDCGHEFIVKQAPKCETFKLTIKDVDGKLVADGTSVTVEDADKNTVATETTTNGIVELTDLEPGVYTVEVDGEKIGTFQSNIDCEATVQPVPSCPQFTLTVKDEDGNVRPNVSNIIIKDKNGAIIATNKTNEFGQIMIPSQDIPSGDYDVYQGELYIGQITVQYSIDCEAEISAAPACPSFTLTVQTAFGTPLANAKVTVKDAKGNVVKDADSNEILTTSVAGTIVLPNKAIQQGTYNVYEGSRFIGSFTVKDTCSALVKPALPGGGGGGSTPDPGNPEEPNKPTPDPGNPEEPNKPTPDPGNPEEPNKPKPDPGNPENPNKPTPDPGNPEEPNKPTPDPGNPENPNKPNPDPGKPVDPEKPSTNPGNPSTDSKDPTAPGKPGTSKPSVEDVIDQGKKLPPYNPSTANKDTLDAYKDFLNKYNNLSQEEQANVAKTLDINKIKEDARRLEAQLKAQGKLPQTDGATQTGLTLIGIVLVLGALFFLRRRNVEM